MRTMGVALSPCILPAVGTATFSVEPGEMEIGMGIHGEPGVRRGPLEQADAIVDGLLSAILAELPVGSGDEIAVLVNGLGATPREELYIMYRRSPRRWPSAGQPSGESGSASTPRRWRWPERPSRCCCWTTSS